MYMKKKNLIRLTVIALVFIVLINTPVTVSAAEFNMTKRDIKYMWVGDTVIFGTYEQDNNTANGKESLEWLVLDVLEGKALLLSKYAIESLPFHEENQVAWKSSSIREWLNNVFLNNAFSIAESALIKETELHSQDNPYMEIPDAGEDTKDRLFLLSDTDFWNYYDVSGLNLYRCSATEYSFAQGIECDRNGNCGWWLRTPAYWSGGDAVACSSEEGVEGERNPGDPHIGVRPAMWIRLDSAVTGYVDSYHVIHCPFCGELIQIECEICPYCEHDLIDFKEKLVRQQIKKASDALETQFGEEQFLIANEFRNLIKNYTDSVLPEVKYYADTTAIKIGNWRLSPADVTMYYNEAYTTFVDSYGEYAELIGLDTDSGITGLLEQACPFENFETWQAYFMDSAIENLKIYSVMLAYAEEKDIALPEEERQELEIYCSEVLDELATEEGYLSVEEMLTEVCGIGNNADSLKTYMINDGLVNTAYNHLWKEFSAIAQQEEEVDSSVSTESDLIMEKMREWVDTNTKELAVEFFPFFKIAGHFPKTQE